MTRQKRPYEYAKDPDPFVVFGIDAEWVFESAGKNRILSYQFCLLNADSGKLAKLIIYPKNGKRISLENGLTRALLKARRENVIDKVPRKFIIAGHFTRADLTTFSDFGYFKRRTGAVRKTYATTEMPLSLRLASNEGPVRCSAVIIDTMLLAPAGTSLEKLGNLLGVPKIDLPEGYSKDRMDIFLQDHRALFEEYALTDAVIPALWVVKTYGLLLDRLGIKKKVVTLGGAAVELVKEQAKSQGNRAARISRARQKEEATASTPGAADCDRGAELSRRLQSSRPHWGFLLKGENFTTWTFDRPIRRRWRSSAFPTGTARDIASTWTSWR